MRFSLDIEDYEDKHLCNAWVATAVVGSAVIGAGASIYGSNKASDAQTNASNAAIGFQDKIYNDIKGELQPYRQAGGRALTELEERLPELTAPIELTQEWLESTPGYKFTRDQGLKSTQNAAAARGLGVSGAALKGAASFATGLADNTYKTQFDVANTNKTNAYNRLKGLVDMGQNAAVNTGTVGMNTANQSSAATIGAGNAQAAAWNNIGGQIGNAANNIGGYAAYKGLYGGGAGAELPGWGTNSFVGPLPG